MNDRGATVRLACIAPVFAYGVLMILAHPLRWSVLASVALSALVLPLVALVTPRFAGWVYGPAAVVLGATALAWLAHPDVASTTFADLSMGLLVGGPVGVFAAIAQHRASVSTVLLGLFGGLGVLEIDLATLRALPLAVPDSSIAWSSTVATVVGNQLTSLSQWAAGASVAPPPLAYAGDVWFDALVLLAASGILLGWLSFNARLGARAVDGARESPPPPGPAWTGVRSLAIAIVALLSFEVAAALSSVWAIAGTLIAVAATSVAVAWLVQPAAPSGRALLHRPAAAEPGLGPERAA